MNHVDVIMKVTALLRTEISEQCIISLQYFRSIVNEQIKKDSRFIETSGMLSFC